MREHLILLARIPAVSRKWGCNVRQDLGLMPRMGLELIVSMLSAQHGREGTEYGVFGSGITLVRQLHCIDVRTYIPCPGQVVFVLCAAAWLGLYNSPVGITCNLCKMYQGIDTPDILFLALLSYISGWHGPFWLFEFQRVKKCVKYDSLLVVQNFKIQNGDENRNIFEHLHNLKT